MVSSWWEEYLCSQQPQKGLRYIKKSFVNISNGAKKKKFYGPMSNPMVSWGNDDYQKVTGWNDQISAMEKVLGLTKEEIKAISAECFV